MTAFYALRLAIEFEGFHLKLDLSSEKRVLGLFGPSGSGKSTILKAIAGLCPAQGYLRIGQNCLLNSPEGVQLDPAARGIGYLPQNHCLFPHWNVAQNLRSGRLPAAMDTAAAQRRFDDVVAVLELEPLLKRPIQQLSGGESQRVALGRALCAMPQLLLLDEPMAAVDSSLRRRILPYLIRVRDEFELPMIIVSHNPLELQALCEEVAVLQDGALLTQGQPVDIFTQPSIYPSTEQAFENILAVEITEQASHSTRASLADTGSSPSIVLPKIDAPLGQRLQIGLAANELLLATNPIDGLSARNCLKCKLQKIETLEKGALALVTIDSSGSAPIAIELTHDAVEALGLQPEREAYLIFKSNSVRIYI